ncbi:MAG: HAMP domain-containing histidine kinase [Clostridia bacterium]|nr:HAMP domain-containing histidine kinase [Clostridia bacterium]
MKRPALLRSVYVRTILMLTLAIVVAFFVLGLVYYHIVTGNSVAQRANQLVSGAQAISDVVSDNLTDSGQLTDPRLINYITFTARASGAVVWVVNPYGELVMHTGIPTDAAAQLDISDQGFYQLTSTHLAAMGTGRSGASLVGDFNGLFKDSGQRWITAVYPLSAPYGGYRGEIQLHYPLPVNTFGSFLMANGLIVSFLAAFAIALLFIGILSHNITRPIRLLSDAADKVARGDLSARVEIPGIENASPEEIRTALVTDDLTILVYTMNAMLEKLQNQERDRKEFITSVSHDLRTPLTSISGFVEGMIDGTVPPEKMTHYLQIVRQETRRLQTLVTTMFDASMLESGQTLNVSIFDINEVLREDIIGLESFLAEKNLGVQTDLEEDDQGRLLIQGDREAISRVVYNILSNAIRFTPDDGVIALTTRYTGRPHEVEVIIEDSGPGIPVADRPYVFDRFYKADKSRTAKGSGLGLYICRTILAAHGQRIYVTDSELGGAGFVFTLQAP